MELEQYICPNCYVKLKKSIWELEYSKKIDDNRVDLYNGICRNCKNKFTFFVDNSYDKAIFWIKEDEKIFSELIDSKNIYNSVKVLYLTNKKIFSKIIEKYNKLPNYSTNVVVCSQDFSDLINKYDLRRNHKIIFISKDILETKFEDNYPCILAERNIYEVVKNSKNFKLYSDTETYFNFFEYLGEK